jgi:hypothetical protein
LGSAPAPWGACSRAELVCGDIGGLRLRPRLPDRCRDGGQVVGVGPDACSSGGGVLPRARMLGGRWCKKRFDMGAAHGCGDTSSLKA